MHCLGISKHVITRCRSYLIGRRQCVKNGNNISSELAVTCGVPQGSILGPSFFIIYVNDLLSKFGELDPKILLYADDTVLYVSANNEMAGCALLDSGLTKLSQWCFQNKLSINIKRTKCLIVDLQNETTNYPRPKLNGEFLDQVDSYNYLGVSIDNKLNFDKFLWEKYGKVHCRVYKLSRMRKYIDSNTALPIYKQMILSLSDYADFMIKSGPNYEISRLTKLHERAVKIIDNNQHELPIGGLMDHYRLQTISERQDEHTFSIMYRQSKRLELLDTARPRVCLRGRGKITFKKYKRTYLKSPLARGIMLWDRLSEEVEKSTTKLKFKKNIQQVYGY